MNYNFENYLYVIESMQPLMTINEYCFWNTNEQAPVPEINEYWNIASQFCACYPLQLENSPALANRSNMSMDEEAKNIPSNSDFAEELESSDIEVLKECLYSLRYDNVGMTSRKRRVILWGYENCGKEFIKAWNFLDHFRMHQGVRPFVWELWDKSFTQKGNLK